MKEEVCHSWIQICSRKIDIASIALIVLLLFSLRSNTMRSLLGVSAAPTLFSHQDSNFAQLVTGHLEPYAVVEAQPLHQPTRSHIDLSLTISQKRARSQSPDPHHHNTLRRSHQPPPSRSNSSAILDTAPRNIQSRLHALDLYYSHYSGLQSTGASGMTVVEELIDAGLRICENGRSAGQKHHARAAVVLSASGKTYVGCDVHLPGNEAQGVSAERAAFLSAIADGASNFEVYTLYFILCLS